MKTFSEYLNEVKEEKIVATDKTVFWLVRNEIDRLGPKANLNHIDVSKVTDMDRLFNDISGVSKLKTFNGNISKWDVSNVKTMHSMFANSSFNGDISKWDVGNVTDMCAMFEDSTFNKDISKWDVSNVGNTQRMFANSKFNQDINNWDLKKVLDMRGMFMNSAFAKRTDSWFRKEPINGWCKIDKMFDGTKIDKQGNYPGWYRQRVQAKQNAENTFNSTYKWSC